jgi:hypothetical protein
VQYIAYLVQIIRNRNFNLIVIRMNFSIRVRDIATKDRISSIFRTRNDFEIFMAMLFTGIIWVVAMTHFGWHSSKRKNVHNLFVAQQSRTATNLQACAHTHTHKAISDRLSNKTSCELENSGVELCWKAAIPGIQRKRPE